ncbi:MAG: RecX family transcriptional regulator [Prevotellaceae bacterium]|jgi:regulatory protein|nr:RecX family transcriptional regulator [Prevotellaceae bacterium]
MCSSRSNALSRLQRLCSRSEKCVADIRRKLVEWNIPAHEAETLIGQLEAQGFIDEVRYAQAFVRDKSRLAHWGAVKIRAALQAKRIPAAVIAQALQEIDGQQSLDTLILLLQRKNATLKAATVAERYIKLRRFALGKGYEPATVAAAIAFLITNDE